MRNESGPLKLLLVEDSPADAYLVREAIRAEGRPFELQVAEDGEIALEILDQLDSPSGSAALSLLLLDINVPRQDGTVVLERLRRIERCAGVPVVMISSSDSPGDRERAFELGATEYFRKPSSLAEFMQLGKIVRRLCMGATAA